MRPVSEAAARIADNSFSRKYIALGRIVNSWGEIVGGHLAHKAQPVKLNYRKKDRLEKPEASLDIAVSSADATLLHYQKDLILERINQIFGEKWVTSIRFVHSAPANTDAAFRRKKVKTPLTAEEKTTLSSMLDGVSDPEIKALLDRLGAEVFTTKL